LAIPDGIGANMQGATIGDIINISDNGTITSVKVNVDVTHPYVQDLVIQLNYPGGSPTSTLWSRDCSSEDGIDIIFEDGASIQDCNTVPPPPLIITGSYAPVTTLSVFNDLEINGDWQILIADFYNNDVGTFNDWYLDICADLIMPLSIDDFNMTNFSIYPNPNNGEFTISLKSLSGNDIKVAVYDMRGRRLFQNAYRNSSNFSQNINLNHLQSGMYLVNVSDGERNGSKKIVIN